MAQICLFSCMFYSAYYISASHHCIICITSEFDSMILLDAKSRNIEEQEGVGIGQRERKKENELEPFHISCLIIFEHTLQGL